MSGQIITIRGTRTDCWFIDRFISDDAQPLCQSYEEEWFDVLAEHWIVAYSEVSTCPTVPFQFALRRPPIVC
jgi:hypothetical protein